MITTAINRTRGKRFMFRYYRVLIARALRIEFRQKAGPSTALGMTVLWKRIDDGEPLSADMHHGARRGHEIGFADVVALFFLLDHAANEFRQFFVGSAAAHLGVQVVVPDGKQAGADLAVGGDADAAAVSAEGMGDRRDDADLADAVVEAVAARGLAAGMRNFDQRPVFAPCARRISSSVTTVFGDQTRSSSSGMNSMKRTITPSSRANMPKGMI